MEISESQAAERGGKWLGKGAPQHRRKPGVQRLLQRRGGATMEVAAFPGIPQRRSSGGGGVACCCCCGGLFSPRRAPASAGPFPLRASRCTFGLRLGLLIPRHCRLPLPSRVPLTLAKGSSGSLSLAVQGRFPDRLSSPPARCPPAPPPQLPRVVGS